MIIIEMRSKVKLTVTSKWYATLRHPKVNQHTKLGVSTSNNIGDMAWTRKRNWRTDRQTDGIEQTFSPPNGSLTGRGLIYFNCGIIIDGIILWFPHYCMQTT